MLKLQGSEKQIAWAEEIRSTMLNMLEEKINLVATDKKATRSEIVSVKDCFPEAKTVGEGRQAYIKSLGDVKEALLLKQDSKWFIAYKNMDSETLVCNYISHKETVFPEVK